MNITLYGIPNCDTVKKARAWLAGRGIAYAFHDYKKAGAEPATLRRWVDAVGWETLLNRAGPTFRNLPDGQKADLDADKVLAIMQAHTSTIKRPVVTRDGAVVLVGFQPDAWDKHFA